MKWPDRIRLWWAPLLLLLAPLTGLMPAHRDLIDFFAPIRATTAEMLISGTPPWLNFGNGCGEAWFANPETAVLYPPAWLHLVLPGPWAMTAEVVFHLAWLSLGVGLLAGRLGASSRGRTLAEVTAWSAGPVLVTVGVLNNLETLAWMPWMVLASRSEGRRSIFLVALTTAMAWLGGEPQVWAMAVAFTFVAARRRGRATVGLILGIALVTVQLIPFLVWVAEGDRGPAAASWALRGALTPADWAGVLAPIPVPHSGRMVYAESLFLGAPILVCALLGVWRTKWVLAVVAGLGLFATLPEIGGGDVFLRLTGGLVRYPSRFAIVGLAVLLPFAGRGADAWLEGRGRLLAVTISGLSLLACILGSHPLRWWVAGIPATIMVIGAITPPTRWLRVFVLAVGVLGMIVAAIPLLGLRPSDRFLASEPVWPEAADGARVYSPAPSENAMQWLASGLESRRLWPVGYLNLEDGLVLARTDSPVANGHLMQHLQVTDRGPESRWWLNVLAARWVVLPVGEGLPEGMVEVRQRGGRRLLRNLEALDEVSLSRGPPVEDEVAQNIGGDLAWEIGGNRCMVVVAEPRPSWLWISLAPVAGWRWQLDGRTVNLEQGPGIVQYLEIPAGPHQLKGRYRPPGLVPAAVVSLSTFLGLMVLMVVDWRARAIRGLR